MLGATIGSLGALLGVVLGMFWLLYLVSVKESLGAAIGSLRALLVVVFPLGATVVGWVLFFPS